jgi:UDP-glucose 4-epimerase
MSQFRWLVTGGAGYIGGHVVADLVASGREVVVLDDLSTGLAERIPADVPFVHASVLDTERVESTMLRYRVGGVVHLAAKKSVPESMAQPLFYYRENVAGFESLLAAAEAARVHRLVLSSSCSVIGTPAVEVVDEDTPTRPESPYGTSKLICEWMVRDAAAARAPGQAALHHAVLRYFNVAGAANPVLGDRGVSNLIPMTFRALSAGRRPQIFGDDYPTRDGSCIRDYIHVVDLARAHVAAAARLETLAVDAPVYAQTLNVGRGEGVTVKEVMAVVQDVAQLDVNAEVVGRRAGDPAAIIGNVDRIRAELGWAAELGLADMVRSAWAAWQDDAPCHDERNVA